MPHKSIAVDVAALNKKYRHHSATEVLQVALKELAPRKIAMVSSFGAESIALLHLLAISDNTVPVLFIDTRLLFAETLVYQADVSEKLGLKDIRILQPSRQSIKHEDPYGALRFAAPDRCCDLRKTRVLQEALDGFGAWITGRKRFQSGTRKELDFFEYDADQNKIKVNPLAHWSAEDIATYMEENRLPRHPLIDQGYPSIGCAPCTSKVQPGEDQRAGRWRNHPKTECGLHMENRVQSPVGERA